MPLILRMLCVGRMMVTQWDQYPLLLPSGLAGAVLGGAFGWLLAKALPPERRRFAVLAAALLVAACLQYYEADITWWRWSDLERRHYTIGGVEALLLSWVAVAVAVFLLVRIGAAVRGARRGTPCPPPGGAA